MRIRSVVCGALILALFCVPFQAGADTLTLPKDLKIINSLAYAGLSPTVSSLSPTTRFMTRSLSAAENRAAMPTIGA